MRVAIIGRTETLHKCALEILKKGHEIPLFITSKESSEDKIKSKDFENLANKIGAKFIYTPKINKSKHIKEIKGLNPIDIGVSINYTTVISQDIINLFGLGILNVHGGDLPKYRGNACQAWAIINRESKIGLCVHRMIGGELDSGDIIDREYLEIGINTRIGEIYEWMGDKAPKLVTRALYKLNSNNSYLLEKQSKKKEDALRCYPRKAEDGRLNWALTAEEIIRLINASSEPFSGAYCFLNNEKLTIWRANLVEDCELFLGVPGQVSKICKETGSIEVLARKGKVVIKEVSYKSDRGVPIKYIQSLRIRLH